MGKSNIDIHTINNEEIKHIDEIRDLGILINKKLDFSNHICKIIRNAYFKSIQLLKIIKSNKPMVWTQAYKIYVRSQLEYSTEVWNPSKKKLIEKIERVQKFFTRIALKKCNIPYTDYDERLKIFQLEKLEKRRLINDLVTLFKIIKGYTNLNPSYLFSFSNRVSRKHQLQIIVKHRNNLTKNSFIVRTTNNWNNLNESIVNSGSVRSFKQQIKMLDF